MEVVVDDSVEAGWARLTDDSNAVSWIACGYEGKDLGRIVLQRECTGGMPEFIAQLPEDDVVWGVFKVVGVDDRGTTVSRRSKFIFVKYLPTAVPSIKRARTGGHKGAIKLILNAAIDVEVSSLLASPDEVSCSL